VGKGLLAKLIHGSSERRDRPFVVINCGGIPENLFESELFGYEPGRSPGEREGKKGLLEVADKGTVFSMRYGDMSLRLQAKLLRVIEEKEMTRLGSTKTVKLDIRICPQQIRTCRALSRRKSSGRIFFQLNTIFLTIPPLRKGPRTSCLSCIILRHSSTSGTTWRRNSHPGCPVPHDVQFPGNARELSNIVEQAFLISKSSSIKVDDLPFHLRVSSIPRTSWSTLRTNPTMRSSTLWNTGC
jgi:transcriptional regulator with PAS, ATPase and Fis domain